MLIDLLYVAYEGGGEFVKVPYGRVEIGDRIRTDFGTGTVTGKKSVCMDNELLLFLDSFSDIMNKAELILEVDDDLSEE